MSSAKTIAGMSDPIARNATASAAMTPTLAYTTVHTMVCAHCRNSQSMARPRKKEPQTRRQPRDGARLEIGRVEEGVAAFLRVRRGGRRGGGGVARAEVGFVRVALARHRASFATRTLSKLNSGASHASQAHALGVEWFGLARVRQCAAGGGGDDHRENTQDHTASFFCLREGRKREREEETRVNVAPVWEDEGVTTGSSDDLGR